MSDLITTAVSAIIELKEVVENVAANQKRCQRLCKRLLSKRDRNDDLERSMISKLKVCTCSMPVTVLGELSGGKSSHARWTGECGVPLHEQARGDVQRHGHIDGGYPKV